MTLPLTPPQSFDFKKPNEWVKWRRRFEQFLCASGLDKEDETRQVSTLMYCLGDDAEGVLTSTNISDDDRKKYKSVMAKLDDYFKVCRNNLQTGQVQHESPKRGRDSRRVHHSTVRADRNVRVRHAQRRDSP